MLSSSLEAVILMNPRSFGKERGKQKWLVMKKQEMRNRKSRDKREKRRDNIVVVLTLSFIWLCIIEALSYKEFKDIT